MDSKTARWMRIVWLDQEDLTGVHQQERLLATRSERSKPPLFVVKNLATWQAMGLIEMKIQRNFPDGYWPREMRTSDHASSLADFERAIYPIWRGIEQIDMESERKMSWEEINSKLILSECLTLHRQDIRIHALGIKPHRMSVSQSRMDEIRAKAIRAGRV